MYEINNSDIKKLMKIHQLSWFGFGDQLLNRVRGPELY